MQFIFPGFLAALAVLAIPIIIHLFYFRRFKKVYFTNVKFLKELKEETSSRSKLRNLLVLLMRLLAFALLVFAFAQPFLASDKVVDARERAVAVYLDNSFSMMSMDQEVPLIDRAKSKAKQIVDGFSESDRFMLLTNELSPRHQRWVDKNTMYGFIEEVSLSPAVQPLSKIIDRVEDAITSLPDSKPAVYIISDFQKNITDLSEPSELDITLLPLGSIYERNLSIDSCWLESPVVLQGQSAKILVKVSNYDNNPAENIRLSLQYGNEKKPVGSLNVPANGSVIDTINVQIKESGWQQMMLEISDYPIQFDDTYYLAFNAPEIINVLAIYDKGPSRYLGAAYGAIPEFELTQQSVNNIDYSQLAFNKLVILNGLSQLSSGLIGQLAQVVNAGVNLLIFPPAGSDMSSVNALLSSLNAGTFGGYETGNFAASYLNTNAFVFDNVFEKVPDNLKLPSSTGRYRLNTPRGEHLVRFRDGNSMMEVVSTEGGYVYISATPLDRDISTIIANAEIFVPMLHRAVLHSKSSGANAFIIGVDEQIELELAYTRGDVTYTMEGPSSFLPGLQSAGSKAILSVFDQITKAGWYQLTTKDNEVAGVFAFNYNRIESNPEKYDAAALAALYPTFTIVDKIAAANLTDFISKQDRGTILWRICLFLALLFLLAEVLILRFWKV